MAVQRWCLRLIGPWTRLNARFPWSHNEAYGPWVAWQARRLRTPRPRRALDVGCGTGHLLLRLARVVDQVTGWEPDPASASAASALTADDHRITVLQRSILDHQEDTDRAGWDLISMVAVLHHLPLQETLNRLRSMIKPGGRLVIVGLSRETGDDLAWSAVSVLLNP